MNEGKRIGFGRWVGGWEGLEASGGEGRGSLRIEVEQACLLRGRNGELSPLMLWLGGENFLFLGGSVGIRVRERGGKGRGPWRGRGGTV